MSISNGMHRLPTHQFQGFLLLVFGGVYWKTLQKMMVSTRNLLFQGLFFAGDSHLLYINKTYDNWGDSSQPLVVSKPDFWIMVSRLTTSLLDLCALSIAGFFLPFLGYHLKMGGWKLLEIFLVEIFTEYETSVKRNLPKIVGLPKWAFFFGRAVQACDVAISQVRNFSLWIWKAD